MTPTSARSPRHAPARPPGRDRGLLEVGAGLAQVGRRGRVEPDRAAAIHAAVAAADARDVILLAGKGHEPYQEIAGVRTPFSDLETAKSALAGRQGMKPCR